jgi:hypothetical protein
VNRPIVLTTVLFTLAGASLVEADPPPSSPPPATAPSPETETLNAMVAHDPYRGFERLDPATIDCIEGA